MAGDTALQLLCKLQVTYNSRPLIPRPLHTRTYLLTLTKHALFVLSHVQGQGKLPGSPHFPHQFHLRNVVKVYKNFLSQGKLTLELHNYPVHVVTTLQPDVTLILISEASYDGLRSLLLHFSPSLPAVFPAKHSKSPLLSLSPDLFHLISSYLPSTDTRKLRLINKFLYKAVGNTVKSLKILKGAASEVVCRLINRCPEVTSLEIGQYKGSARTVCAVLKGKTGLVRLNLLECRVKDGFLSEINGVGGNLQEVRLRGFQTSSLCPFLWSSQRLCCLYLSSISLETALLLAIQSLPSLSSLSLRYHSIETDLSPQSWSSPSLSCVSILPLSVFPTPTCSVSRLWQSLSEFQLEKIEGNMETVGEGRMWESVRTLGSCVLPARELPRLKAWTVYCDAGLILQWLPAHSAWVSALDRLHIVLPNDWLAAPLLTEMRHCGGTVRCVVGTSNRSQGM